jgi:hypothetical protein
MILPASSEAYGTGAMNAQRAHFLILGFQLSLAVGGSAVAAATALLPTVLPAVAGFSVIVVLFVVGILLQLLATRLNLDKRWYSFRAVRESQKSLAWQYSMCLGEFATAAEDPFKLYLDAIAETENEFDIKPPLPVPDPEDEDRYVSNLRASRSQGWQARRAAFVEERVDDQVRWYGAKAAANRRSALSLDFAVVGLQLVGIVCGVALINLRLNGSALLAVVLAGLATLVAWGQAKQYSALIGPYTNAQRELMTIRQMILAAATEPEFLRSASQAEEAISREHSLWCARRGLQLARTRH